jgi:hypothetical protein
MKSNRPWLPVLAFLMLPFFASAAAHALADCNNEFICNCQKACSTRCTPSPGLPLLSCGEWGYDCIGSPNCNLLTSSSAESTWSTSSTNSDLQRIFSPSSPVASMPAKGR